MLQLLQRLRLAPKAGAELGLIGCAQPHGWNKHFDHGPLMCRVGCRRAFLAPAEKDGARAATSKQAIEAVATNYVPQQTIGSR